MTPREKLGIDLFWMRDKTGMTQRELARAIGYTGTTGSQPVSGWETGKQLPPVDKLGALAAALKVRKRVLVDMVYDAKVDEINEERWVEIRSA